MYGTVIPRHFPQELLSFAPDTHFVNLLFVQIIIRENEKNSLKCTYSVGISDGLRNGYRQVIDDARRKISIRNVSVQ